MEQVARMMSGTVICQGDSCGGGPGDAQVVVVLVPCAAAPVFASEADGRPIVQPRKSPQNVRNSARNM